MTAARLNSIWTLLERLSTVERTLGQANLPEDVCSLTAARDSIWRELNEIIDWIYAIPDSDTRICFVGYYVWRLSWKRLAIELGRTHMPDALKRRRDRYMRAEKRKMEELRMTEEK